MNGVRFPVSGNATACLRLIDVESGAVRAIQTCKRSTFGFGNAATLDCVAPFVAHSRMWPIRRGAVKSQRARKKRKRLRQRRSRLREIERRRKPKPPARLLRWQPNRLSLRQKRKCPRRVLQTPQEEESPERGTTAGDSREARFSP